MKGSKPNCSDYRMIKTMRMGLARHIAGMRERRIRDRRTN
jgi:hypothetical protein